MSNDNQRRTIWAGLFVYAVAGWLAVEILFAVRERIDLPQTVEPVVLGLFVAGFLATALLGILRRRDKSSPLVQSLQFLGVAAVCSALALGVAHWLQPPDETDILPSIAILPCTYEGAEEYEYLSFSLAEEVNNRLGLQSELRVPGWRAVLQAHGADPSPEFLAEQLAVEHVATCMVQRSEEQTVIEARVFRPPDPAPLLQQRYETSSTNLPSAVAELAVTLVDRVAPRVKVADRLRHLPTANPEAYELYLKRNLPLLEREDGERLVDANEESQSLLRRAITLDPDFADAYAHLAGAQWVYAHEKFDDVGQRYYSEAQDNVLKALSLDDCNAFAWAIGAMLRRNIGSGEVNAEWRSLTDRMDKETMIRRSIECDPNHYIGWLFLSRHYAGLSWAANTQEDFFHSVQTRRESMARLMELSMGCPLVAEYYGELIPTHSNAGGPYKRLSVEDQLSYEHDPTAWRTQRTEEVQEQTAEGLATLRRSLALGSDCPQAYSLFAAYSAGPAVRRLDRALAWEIKSLDSMGPGITRRIRQIAVYHLELGLLQQAADWGDRLGEGMEWQPDVLVLTRLAQGDPEPMLATAGRWVELNVDTKAPRIIKEAYRGAATFASYARDFELAADLLEQGMSRLGITDPSMMLPEQDNSVFGRLQPLYLALAYQRVGQPDRADALLEKSRTLDPVFATVTDHYESTRYVDAVYESLSGNPGEALHLARFAMENWQTDHGRLLPGKFTLLTDPALDSVRQHPEYGPQLQELIDEFEVVLAPMRERVLEAEASGNWDSLRTL